MSAARWLRQLPRDKADTMLLLLSSIMVLAPHASHLPGWITAVVSATLLWRSTITLRGNRLPPLPLLLPIAVLAMAGVYSSYKTLLGRDAGVAMLSLLLAFKLLEMHARRDLFVVIFLSFFLLLTNFFYSQSIATAALMIASVIVLLTAQLSFQFTGAVPPLLGRLRMAGKVFLIAAPLGLALFVLFPRVQGPLWGMPGDAQSGRTGLSDSMAPGNVSNLAKSDDIAFRARFEGKVPSRELLYWRAVVMADYDGRTWRRSRNTHLIARGGQRIGPDKLRAGQAVDYQITQEAGSGRWLFGLDLPQQVPQVEGHRSSMSNLFEMATMYPVDRRVRYQVRSVLDYRLEADASPEQLHQWLLLPRGFNPRTLALAERMRRPDDPLASLNAALSNFRNDKFSYTMEPPLLGRDAVDQFLFETKAGFCEHYSSAFVVLMRAMGIPARVVTGYQGGELNPVDRFLTVRQSDAHAWAEVWLAGRGWVRVDPTAAVSPERISINLSGAVPSRAPFGLQALNGLIDFEADQHSLLGQLRNNFNAVNNSWNQWVLDYTPERQQGVLSELSASLGNWRAALAASLVVALLLLARRLRARSRLAPLDALYDRFCQLQARRGLARAPDEGPHAYARRLRKGIARGEQRDAMLRFLAIYSTIKYGVASDAQRASALATLAQLLKRS